MKILAIVPARGGSKGLPQKNIKDFNGKPLIYWTIKAAKDSKYINKIIVSTDDPEIAKISESFGAEIPGLRPKELSEDNTPTLPVIHHVLDQLNRNQSYVPDLIITLQATSPLRNSKHIDEALDLFLNSPSADSLVSCTKVPHNFNPESLMTLNNYSFLEYINSGTNLKFSRQDKKIYFARNGAAIYITKYNVIDKGLLVGKILPFFMKLSESIDIDNIDDFFIAESISKNLNKC
jgi:CMP-N,N'-diacetyllegionaminic acid synthase